MAYKYLGVLVPGRIDRCGATFELERLIAANVGAHGGRARLVRRERHIHSGDALVVWRIDCSSNAAPVALFGPAVHRAVIEALPRRRAAAIAGGVLAEVRVFESRGNGQNLRGARELRFAPGANYAGLIDASSGQLAFGRDIDNTVMDFSPVLSAGPRPDRPPEFDVVWYDQHYGESDDQAADEEAAYDDSNDEPANADRDDWSEYN